MCFSPTASFTAGIALGAVGCLAIANAKRPSDVPFASVPLLFGIQQVTEGFIWLSVGSPSVVLKVMTCIFLLFSHVVWPVLLPAAVFLLEPRRWRRWVLGVCIGIGAVVSVYFLYYLLTEDVQAAITGECITYSSRHFFKTFILSPYSVATCISCLFSSHKLVNLFGVVTFLAAVIAFQFYQYAFISVWCFFSAILSVIIYLHFRSLRR